VDLMNIGSYTELPGGNIALPQGYSSILAPIVKPIPEDNILKQKPVKCIHWTEQDQDRDGNNRGESYDSDNDSNCSVRTVKSIDTGQDKTDLPILKGLSQHSQPASNVNSRRGSNEMLDTDPSKRKSGKPNVRVETESGETFFADHLICTLPLGIVRNSPNLFDPPLSDERKNSLNKMVFGTVNKIFLAYDKPFLNPDVSEIIVLWNRVEEQLPMPERWFRKIYSFVKVSETVILAWVCGEEAKYMETLKMNVVADTCTMILKKFLADPLIPKPKSCLFTSWYSQPYTGGSYTAIGTNGSQADIETYAEPLYKGKTKQPIVTFAGEHCHPSFYSTGHGAYLTGRTAAQQVIRAVRDNLGMGGEATYNLQDASVSDLSTWLQEVSVGEKNLEDYRASSSNSRPRRDDGNFVTPR